MQQTIPANQPKPAREEMWLIILAKSKTMRFFSVSCEFILFLGCLWLTMTTILPSADTWLQGGLNSFFLVSMGFAVDAAMPEAWLHVADQFTDNPRKKTQLWWSIPIAILMSLLVVANVTYSKIAGASGETPTGGMEAFVNALLITRILIGISYVAIRECQSFIDRKQAKQQPAQPALPDFQAMITKAIEVVTSEQAKVNQHMLAALEEVKKTIVPVDTQAIADLVLTSLETKFTSEMKRLQSEVKQQVSIWQTGETPAIEAPKQGVSHQVKHSSETVKQPVSSQVKHQRETVKQSASHQVKQASETPANITTLPVKNDQVEDIDALIIRLWNEDRSRSHRKIAGMIDASEATVYRKLKQYRETLPSGEAPAIETGEAVGSD